MYASVLGRARQSLLPGDRGLPMNASPPYSAGDRVMVTLPDGSSRIAIVTTLVSTTSLDPGRRWRLLCRWDTGDGAPVASPLYCGHDGQGEQVTPGMAPVVAPLSAAVPRSGGEMPLR